MASNKRKPGKSMRQQRNRTQRQRLEARSAHAGEATAISRGEVEPVSGPIGGDGESDDAAPKAPANDKRAQRREMIKKRYPIPGQRAILMAFLFSLVTAVMLAITPLQFFDDLPADDPRTIEAADDNDDGVVTITVPADDPDAEGVVDDDGDGEVEIEVAASDIRAIEQELDEGDDEGTYAVPRQARVFSEFSAALAIALIGIPIAITGVAYAMTKHPKRSMIWTLCLLAFAAYIFLFAAGVGILALPSMVALGIGNFQSRKAESTQRLAEVRARRAAEADGAAVDGDVIDVDSEEVDVEEAVDDESENSRD